MNTKIESITFDNGLQFNWDELVQGSFVDYNGIYLTHVEKGMIRGATEIKPEYLNPLGVLHGGAIVTLADTVAIMGCCYLYEAVEAASTGLNIQYLRPVKSGKVFAEGKVLSKGKSVSSWQVDVYDEDKNHIAAAQVAFFVTG